MTIEGYALEEPLGEGAMGTVWRARRCSSIAHAVALKRVRLAGDGGHAARLRHEAEVLAGLDHPHIVRVFDVVPDGDGVAIAMQLAAGGSLADLLARRIQLSPAETLRIAVPVSEALESAHRRGIVHGDVKPANILLTSDGEPLLSDFGIARTAARPPLPDASPSVGTAEYLDPAVAAGTAPGAGSDVYSLGVVCYEALAGLAPFLGATPEAVLAAAAAGARPLLEAAPDVPPPLAAVVQRAMARDPADRFPTAGALAVALRAAAGEVIASPQPPMPVPAGATGDAAGPSSASTTGTAGEGVRTSRRETRPFGPRPPRRPPPEPMRRTRAVVARAAVVLAVATAAFGLDALGPAVSGPAASGPAASGGYDDAVRSTPPGSVSSTTAPYGRVASGGACPPSAARPAPPPAEVLHGDVDGDGCDDVVVRAGNVLTRSTAAGVERFALGAASDVPVLGDWDCDGRVTPGLYRPSSGEAFLFKGWASPGEPLPASKAVRAGGPGTARPDVALSDCGRRSRGAASSESP